MQKLNLFGKANVISLEILCKIRCLNTKKSFSECQLSYLKVRPNLNKNGQLKPFRVLYTKKASYHTFNNIRKPKT